MASMKSIIGFWKEIFDFARQPLNGRIDAPVKVDITTGDAIYPSQVRHKFELMFDQGTLDVLSYHPATVLAEKLETVLRRGEANTRGRDFYDLYAIPRYYSESISEQDLREALRNIAEKRGSQQAIAGSLRLTFILSDR